MSMLIGKIEPGDVVGRCRIIRELGRGGVGTVYLANHQTLQIEVALKVLSPSLSLDNPALAERFIREAQLAARIRHPNVIAVMDAAHDEPTGLYFIVLEYVGGGALSWHLRHGSLPEAKALSVITGIAHALVLAEENRVVHRDIKPDNIMLDLRGTAKLADLGLAKHSIDSRTSLTLGGSYMGTPAYMSPEQACDAKVADTRDDIYSLGATFYECLTGEPPFQGETPYNIMSELLTKPSPQPRVHRPELSRSVDLICRKMMAKTRALRYADARTLLQDLQHCQLFGDAGIEKLEAFTLESDSVMARRQALEHGIHTSSEGVAGLSESVHEGVPGPYVRPTFAPSLPRPPENSVYRAAALLLLFVSLATLLLVKLGPHSSLAALQNSWNGTHSSTTNSIVSIHPDTPSPQPTGTTPSGKLPLEHSPAQPVPELTKVEPPTNTAPNLPVVALPDTQTNQLAIPISPSTAQSAFAARAIAEASLITGVSSPTGEGLLLKAVGKRGALIPSTWTFYFYDTTAWRNARIVTVSDGKVVKNGDSLMGLPYKSSDIIPNEQLLIDSTDALLKAAALIPGVTVSNSQFELIEKDSVPIWRLTLWARNAEGEEENLGGVTILADTGVVSSNTLNPERVVRR